MAPGRHAGPSDRDRRTVGPPGSQAECPSHESPARPEPGRDSQAAAAESSELAAGRAPSNCRDLPGDAGRPFSRSFKFKSCGFARVNRMASEVASNTLQSMWLDDFKWKEVGSKKYSLIVEYSLVERQHAFRVFFAYIFRTGSGPQPAFQC